MIQSPRYPDLRGTRRCGVKRPVAVADRPLVVLSPSGRRVDSARRAAAFSVTQSGAPRAPGGGRPSARTGSLRRRRRGPRSRRTRRRRFVGVAARGSQDVGSTTSASICFADVVVDRLRASARSAGTPAMTFLPNAARDVRFLPSGGSLPKGHKLPYRPGVQGTAGFHWLFNGYTPAMNRWTR